MAKMYNVIFEWNGNPDDCPDLYVTYYDGSYVESRTMDFLIEKKLSPKAMGLAQAVELMTACNSGKFWDLIGYDAVITNAIKKNETDSGFSYLDVGVRE